MEKERNTYKQKLETSEKHQETLRETIKSQKSVIKEQQLSAQVHSNLAMMFLDEAVDEGDTITLQEKEEKLSQMKEIHKINNELQKKLEDLNSVNTELSVQIETQKQEEKRLVERVKSLEATNRDLTDTSQAQRLSIENNNNIIQNLQHEMKEKDHTIDTLNSKIKVQEENPGNELTDLHATAKNKEILDLQVDNAHLEKNNQELSQRLFLYEEQIKKMQEVWENDKNRLLNTEERYCDAQLEVKYLSQKLNETKTQLAQIDSLRTMKEEIINTGQPQQSPTNANPQGGIERSEEASTKETRGPEICVFELIEQGKCRRKQKCKFSHEIVPHMREESWLESKIAQLSEVSGRCVKEMVKKGSCPKKNECVHPHLNDITPTQNKKICFKEYENAGSCPRGNECKFSHEINNSIRNNEELQKQAAEYRSSSRWICINEYRKANTCRKGANCGFRHDISDEERTSPVLQEKMNQKWDRITSKSKEEQPRDVTTGQDFPKPFIDEFRMFMKEWRNIAMKSVNCP